MLPAVGMLISADLQKYIKTEARLALSSEGAMIEAPRGWSLEDGKIPRSPANQEV